MFRIETHILVSVIGLACVAGGYATTVPNAGLAAAHVIKVDFDQTFADAAAGRRELPPMIVTKTDGTGQNASRVSQDAPSSQIAVSVNRSSKSDRLSVPASSAPAASKVHTIVIRRSAPTPEVGCEALAAPYADLVLGRIIGRCVV